MIIHYVITGMIILCMFVAITNYYSNMPTAIKLLSLPFTIILSIYVIYFVYDKLGSPIEAMPSGEFTYIHHKADAGGEKIMLWASTNEKDRLYVFLYNRENMKKLNEAQKKAQGENREVEIEVDTSNGLLRILEDYENITDEIGSDARIKQE
tara:strand:- start:157 stop:612 length:456 start_codon:yes stop_codon:yes gene_type:complete